MNFAEYLDMLIQKSGKTKADIAKETGIQRTYLSHLTNPRRNIQPTRDILERLAKALNVNYLELLSKTEYLAGYTMHYGDVREKPGNLEIPIFSIRDFFKNMPAILTDEGYDMIKRNWKNNLTTDICIYQNESNYIWLYARMLTSEFDLSFREDVKAFPISNAASIGPSDLLLIDLKEKRKKYGIYLSYEKGNNYYLFITRFLNGNPMSTIAAFDFTPMLGVVPNDKIFSNEFNTIGRIIAVLKHEII